VEAQMLKQGGVLLELSDPLQLFPREVEATISDMKGPRFNAELLEIPAVRDTCHAKLGLGLLESHKLRWVRKGLRVMLHGGFLG